jgi:hypothetical protein
VSSSSARARHDLARADRGTGNDRTFQGVDPALSWYYLYRERMQSPHSATPRVEHHLVAGELVAVPMGHIEGGRGGDVGETMATISTIGAALRDLQLVDPVEHELVELVHRDGWTLRRLGERFKMAAATVSSRLGNGETHLRALLRRDGILR